MMLGHEREAAARAVCTLSCRGVFRGWDQTRTFAPPLTNVCLRPSARVCASAVGWGELPKAFPELPVE
jgi:hypothetical protein